MDNPKEYANGNKLTNRHISNSEKQKLTEKSAVG